MRVFIAGFAVGCMVISQVFAQDEHVVRIDAGKHAIKDFPKDQRFLYSAYQPGKIHYINGEVSSANPFNYDVLLGVITAIQNPGDTVAIMENARCRYIEIGPDIFFHTPSDQYVQIIAAGTSSSLAMREEYVFKRREKVINNGSTSYVDQTNWEGTVWNSRRVFPQFVNPNYNLLFHRNASFFLIDKNNNVVKANKSTILLLYPHDHGLIENFIKVKQTNFNSKEDLKELFSYCCGLNG